MTYFSNHYYALNNFKKGQLDSNRQEILEVLRILGKAQAEQISKFLEKRNNEAALALYEKGLITKAKMKEYCKEKTLSKRTIHRHLNFLLKKGLLERLDHDYRVVDKVKNDMIYWSHEYGDSVLYALMHCYSPQVLTFEQNIEELIKIFGIYTLCCLIEAAHPPVNEGDNPKVNSPYRDKLTVSWINEVFNPQRMLEYFIASMTQLPSDDAVRRIWDNTFAKGQNTHVGRLDEIDISNSTRNWRDVKWIDENGHNLSPESAYDLYTKRWWQKFLPIHELSNTTRKPFYTLNIDIIRKITELIEKEYSMYYKAVVQKTQNGDIITMSNNLQNNMEKWLSLAANKPINKNPL